MVVAVLLLERPAQQLAAVAMAAQMELLQLMPLQTWAAVAVAVWGLGLGRVMAAMAAAALPS